MKIEIYTDKSGQTRFRIKGSNGRVVVPVESYRRKQSCLKTVHSLKRSLATAEIKYVGFPKDLTKAERSARDTKPAKVKSILRDMNEVAPVAVDNNSIS